ncbi:MAG: hypothetical protein AAF495_13550 [Pseudomonadota bacterium]
MKHAATRFAQLYIFIFILISGLIFAVNLKTQRVDDALPTAIVHGAIWPVTVVDWLSSPH